MEQTGPSPDLAELYRRLHLKLQGEHICGYKIGATNQDAQRSFGIDTPFYAYLLESRRFGCGARIQLPAGSSGVVVEAEFCYELEGPSAIVGNPLDRIARIWLAIEVVAPPGGTFEGLSLDRLIETNGIHYCLVRGRRPLPPDLQITPDLRVELFINSNKVAEGTPAYVYGHPLNSLRWFAKNSAAALPVHTDSMLVTTGSCLPPVQGGRGDTIRAVFGDLGEVTVEIEGGRR